jgi:biotin carboxyl carrier protein
VKFKVEAGERTFELDLQEAGTSVQYAVTGATQISGQASLVPISPGVYSILLGTRSITVNLSKGQGQYETSSGGRRLFLTVADKRDRAERQRAGVGAGPVEVRAQMPGKIISLLVAPGTEVEAGQSLLVIEAMKMQNELKSPKSGIVSKLLVSEGETVAANHRLVVIE